MAMYEIQKLYTSLTCDNYEWRIRKNLEGSDHGLTVE